MKPAAGKRDAGRRRTQTAQPRQRVGRGIVEIDEDRRQRQQVTFTPTAVAQQPAPPQSDGDKCAPTELVGCQQPLERIVKLAGLVERDVS
ncbi:MAG: hypothetical protein K8J31_05875 [Anaerolineae bacterium]|nr:hypothetical protein [Anaerolineae bacterium]